MFVWHNLWKFCRTFHKLYAIIQLENPAPSTCRCSSQPCSILHTHLHLFHMAGSFGTKISPIWLLIWSELHTCDLQNGVNTTAEKVLLSIFRPIVLFNIVADCFFCSPVCGRLQNLTNPFETNAVLGFVSHSTGFMASEAQVILSMALRPAALDWWRRYSYHSFVVEISHKWLFDILIQANADLPFSSCRD